MAVQKRNPPADEPLPFGEWPSPISAKMVAAGGISITGPVVRDASDGTEIWWAELRPNEGGRSVVVRRKLGEAAVDVLAPPFSARTRVHEYGGGAWFLGKTSLYFSNWDDQRLYQLDLTDPEAKPEALTPDPEVSHALRFADGIETPDGCWAVMVMEDHTNPGGEAKNTLVAVSTSEPEELVVLVDGPDFVSAPRISPDGRWLSWIQWDHPSMPWDESTLCAAPLFDGPRLGNVQVVAGGTDQSVPSADWTSGGDLVFSLDGQPEEEPAVADRWNLHSWRPGSEEYETVTELTGADIGYPPWVFGLKPWTELSDGRLAVIETTDAADRLAIVNSSASVTPIPSPYVSISGLSSTTAGDLVAVAQTKTETVSVVELSPMGDAFPVRPAEDLGLDPAWVSVAEPMKFTTADDETRHAFFYAPAGKRVRGPGEDLPPLIVMGHGGPTAHNSPALNLKIQYWTSRGFAVADVNYGGSTGFGRRYRRLLDGQWGVLDVADCVAVVSHLVTEGRVDANRVAIRGGSAGGFTVLRALITSDVFSAGTSLYGIADLETLVSDTHKFESRYTDGLIGPYPAQAALYRQRSPIHQVDDLTCPLLVLQGTEDEVVPPNQAEAIVSALAAKGIPHAVEYFEGEQHGFRKAENIERSLEAELWFYGKVFGFSPAEAIDPVDGAVGLT